jgi:hypothetical protein
MKSKSAAQVAEVAASARQSQSAQRVRRSSTPGPQSRIELKWPDRAELNR